MRTRVAARSVWIALSAATLLATSGCTVGTQHPVAQGKPPTHTHVVTVTGSRAHSVTLTEGQLLHVLLSSTYWHFESLSGPGVLGQRGPVRVVPRTRGCVPGEGCGIVEVTYVATGAGTVTVRAARSSCGEAMGCTSATGRFALKVTVR